MNLYLLIQDVESGYDTYDSCVVAAETPEDAVTINPSGDWRASYPSWAHRPDQVHCQLIGVAIEGTERGEILSSFNAG